MLKKLALCIVLAGAPHIAVAQSVQDQIVAQLAAQGFSEIALNRTWLGRIRVVAMRDGMQRELVFNPQTGEILRDYWTQNGTSVPMLVDPDYRRSDGADRQGSEDTAKQDSESDDPGDDSTGDDDHGDDDGEGDDEHDEDE